MTIFLARLLMTLASTCMGDDRRDWSLAMQAEYEVAAADGQALSFASGCLVAAWRELLASPQGRFTLTNYVAALGIMLPMAALQIGCAVFGLPYLYPGEHGLPGAMLVGGSHETLLRSIYLGAVPALALIQLITGIGHVRLAWLLVERDWPGAIRWALWTLAGATALVIFMSVLFLDAQQALLQAAIVGLEVAAIAIGITRHAEIAAVRNPTG